MRDTTEAYDFRGRTLLDGAGEKIGKIEELYYDEQGGQPEWALVNTGLSGTKKTFVPIQSATPTGENVQVPVTKEQVKEAPRIDADQELSESEERQLFDHYGVPYTTAGSTTAAGSRTAAESTGRERGVGHDMSGPNTGPNTDDAMTRSEEELRVGTAERERGRVRLRKHVVTENVHRTVPVRREEVRVEREPISDRNIDDAMSGSEISDEEHEVVLREEQPVVEKRTVPKERVRLETEAHQDEHEISEEVRKEQLEVDDSRHS
jgi:uncharacterized protein (TIGR02271 family)